MEKRGFECVCETIALSYRVSGNFSHLKFMQWINETRKKRFFSFSDLPSLISCTHTCRHAATGSKQLDLFFYLESAKWFEYVTQLSAFHALLNLHSSSAMRMCHVKAVGFNSDVWTVLFGSSYVPFHFVSHAMLNSITTYCSQCIDLNLWK